MTEPSYCPTTLVTFDTQSRYLPPLGLLWRTRNSVHLPRGNSAPVLRARVIHLRSQMRMPTTVITMDTGMEVTMMRRAMNTLRNHTRRGLMGPHEVRLDPLVEVTPPWTHHVREDMLMVGDLRRAMTLVADRLQGTG